MQFLLNKIIKESCYKLSCKLAVKDIAETKVAIKLFTRLKINTTFNGSCFNDKLHLYRHEYHLNI